MTNEVFNTLVNGAASARSRKLADRIDRHGKQLFITGSENLPVARQEVERLRQALADRSARNDADVERRAELRSHLADLELAHTLDGVDNTQEQGEVKAQISQLTEGIESFAYAQAGYQERIEQAQAAVAELEKRTDQAEVERLLVEERQLSVELYNKIEEATALYVNLQRKYERKQHLQDKLYISHDGMLAVPRIVLDPNTEKAGRTAHMLEVWRVELLG